MRIDGAAIVKNEADVIEAFVRHNLQYLDALHIVDNGSTDGTEAILAALVADGLALHVTVDPRTDHPQANAMTQLLADADQGPDWMFCLDADEFIDAGGRERFREIVSGWDQEHCHVVGWDFFVPTVEDDPQELNPVRRITHRRDAPVDPWLSKTVVARRYLGRPGISVSPGNHTVIGEDGLSVHHQWSDDIRLGHFPVRSAQQLARKAVIGDWAISARNVRGTSEGHHWSRLRARILAGQQIPMGDLTAIAADYGSHTEPAGYALRRSPLLAEIYDLTHTPSGPPDFRQEALLFADKHFALLRRTALRQGPVQVAKTRHGLLVHRSGSDPISRSLVEYGGWVDQQIEFLLGLVPTGGVVVDVSAGVGAYTLPFARAVGASGRVVAVEPDLITHRLLCAGLALNDCDNVTDIARQITGTSDPAVMSQVGDRLDLLRLGRGVDAGALIGASAEALERLQSVVVVSWEPGVPIAGAVEALTARGYTAWWHVEPRYQPGNFAGSRADIFAPDEKWEAIVLCLPPGSPDPGLPVVAGAQDTPESAWQAQGARPHRPPIDWTPRL